MGLFEKIFKKSQAAVRGNFFETLTAYTPAFTDWGGELYESDLVRSAIDAKARHVGKLKVEINGTAKQKLQTKLSKAPNSWQTWYQFMYRLSTILDMQNTAVIVPVLGDGDEIDGVYPVLPSLCELVEYNDVIYMRYQFSNGKRAAIEFSKCGIMTRFQYDRDFFGNYNTALNATMSLINIQNQGIEEATKSAASFRFMARVNNFTKPEDLAKEQQRFTKNNLQSDAGGVLLFPNTYNDIRQITSTPYVIDAEQRKIIQTNVYNYFGVNEEVLQNKCYGDAWNGFYEGSIEPFAVQFSEVMTKMLFSDREQAQGSYVMATSNRLQYMSNNDKLNVSAQMADRGIMNRDEIREIWNLPPLPDGQGQKYIIRGEYYDADEKIQDGGGTDGSTEEN